MIPLKIPKKGLDTFQHTKPALTLWVQCLYGSNSGLFIKTAGTTTSPCWGLSLQHGAALDMLCNCSSAEQTKHVSCGLMRCSTFLLHFSAFVWILKCIGVHLQHTAWLCYMMHLILPFIALLWAKCSDVQTSPLSINSSVLEKGAARHVITCHERAIYFSSHSPVMYFIILVLSHIHSGALKCTVQWTSPLKCTVLQYNELHRNKINCIAIPWITLQYNELHKI